VAGLIAGGVLLVGTPAGHAKVWLTMDEALAQAFPQCEVERRTVYLTESQLARARDLAGVEIDGALVIPYVARRGEEDVGTAYFDTHRVRTLPETLMVVIDADHRLVRIAVLSFREPEEYLPSEAWYRQFNGRVLDDDLNVKRTIHAVTGATLTVRVTADAVRRVLAIHRVLSEEEP
jgi:hypothetical protein